MGKVYTLFVKAFFFVSRTRKFEPTSSIDGKHDGVTSFKGIFCLLCSFLDNSPILDIIIKTSTFRLTGKRLIQNYHLHLKPERVFLSSLEKKSINYP